MMRKKLSDSLGDWGFSRKTPINSYTGTVERGSSHGQANVVGGGGGAGSFSVTRKDLSLMIPRD